MKLYDSLGPNPRLVRMFLAEKGVEIADVEQIDIMAGGNRQAPYTDVNPRGQMPALVADDGTVICETIPICEYLEEVHPKPALIGSTPEEKADARMWERRIEFAVTSPLADGFRFSEGLAMFKDRLHTIPHAADDLKEIAREGLVWLDGELAGRPYLCGDRLTFGDIVLYCVLDFGKGVGQPYDTSLGNLHAWFERMEARPSAEASLHPAALAAGMRA